MSWSTLRALRFAVRILVVALASGCARTPDFAPWPLSSSSGRGNGAEDDAGDDGEQPAAEVDETDGGDAGMMEPDAEMKCAAIRDKAPVAQGVDVIFVLDSSGTMLHAIGQVQANIASFVDAFAADGKDIRVVMITALDPLSGSAVAQDPDKYLFLQANVLGGLLYQTAIDQFPNYESFLRPTAAVQFVMVTSSDDLMTYTSFETAMKALLGGRDFTQHAIASPNVNGFPCISESQSWNPLCAFPIPAICAALAVGRAYNALAEETHGEQFSVCKDDWGDVFATLKKSVIDAVPLPCNFLLPAESLDKIDPERVSMFYTHGDDPDQEIPRAEDARQCEDKLGWYYDDPYAPTLVTLCPAACDTVAAGGSMDLAFGCAPPKIL